MQHAHLELVYRRRQDNRKVTLLAELPSIRALSLGGSPSDLRLPGCDRDASYATIFLTYDRFRIEAVEPMAPGLTLNGQPPPHAGVELNEGDVIRIDEFELTFHDGELPSEPAQIDTPLRWKMPRSLVDDSALYESSDETARAYIEEFQLSARPMLQAQRHKDVQKLAEAEISRLIRSEEIETLETYASFLWWTRARSAREAEDPQALDIAVEAIDLHPDCIPLLVVCGTSFLRGAVWNKALDAFKRAQSGKKLPFLASIHDARLGRILAEHMQAVEQSGKPDAKAFDQWQPDDWDVPTIDLDAPGDESLFWRLAHYAEIFGDDARRLRFVFRGSDEDRSDETFDVQRWDIANLKSGQVRRRLLRIPTLPYADPTLVVEAGLLRQAYSTEEKDWTQCLVDLSNRLENEPDDGTPAAYSGTDATAWDPLVIDPQAVNVLTRLVRPDAACLRFQSQPGSAAAAAVVLEAVAGPAPGDRHFQQGSLKLAVAGADATLLSGARVQIAQSRVHVKLKAGATLPIIIKKEPAGKAAFPLDPMQIILYSVLLITVLIFFLLIPHA